jgi:S-(hydroxymethyl)glutathione dehydrogenase/alcohol dehydrogenase
MRGVGLCEQRSRPRGGHVTERSGIEREDAAAEERALERLAPSGRYVMIGQPATGRPVCINAARHMFDGDGKTIKATQGGGFRPHLDVPRYLRIADDLFVHGLITHRVPLAQINQAFDLVRAGESGRVLITINPE